MLPCGGLLRRRAAELPPGSVKIKQQLFFCAVSLKWRSELQKNGGC